jgi:hypothetical protein
MILLKVLSGNKAGTEVVARRFPFNVGRQAAADLRLEDGGVWEDHFRIELSRKDGLLIFTRPEAVTTLNGEAIREGTVRNGDVIGAGSARMRAWLSSARQSSGMLREGLAWAVIVGVTLAQIVLIYFLS